MVTHIDNTPEGSHNWLKSLRSVIEEKAALEPMFDPANSKQRSADTDENVVKMSTRDAAALVGADFDVDYRSAHFQSGEKANDGYGHQFTNQNFVVIFISNNCYVVKIFSSSSNHCWTSNIYIFNDFF